jgi:hypothetical protein
MMHVSSTHLDTTSRSAVALQNRPDDRIFNRSIPLFFIGRNKHGFWLAREANGRVGGMFLLRRSALRFAQDTSAPRGCATMFLAKAFELDIGNSGNPVVGWLDAALGIVSRFVPDEPPPIPFTDKYRRRDWL